MQPSDVPLVRGLAGGDVPAATDVVARAFEDNPGYLAAFAHLTDASRRRAVHRLKRGFVEAAVRYQHADGITHEGALRAVALWNAPGEYPVSLAAKAWQGAWALTTGPRGVANLLRLDVAMARRHLREPHYYLFVLGVAPEAQGRGLGSRVLEHLNAIGDARRLPWYLETDKPSSVRLYQRHGYDVVDEFVMKELGDLRMWCMRRAPR